MKRLLRLLSMFICMLLLAAPVGWAGAQAAEEPAVIATVRDQGLEILGSFDAPGGLRGYAGLAGDQPVAVYVTPDGQHAVIGAMIDVQGNDVGAEAMSRLVAGPMTDRIWAQLEDSHWVPDGKPDAPRVVYTFSDPNCPYCNRFWHAARPWVDAGKVQLRHVLVGVIRPDSAPKAAAIFTAANPEKALRRNEEGYKQGGIEPVESVPEKTQVWLDENELLMADLGFRGTPGILFKNAEGELQKRNGMPRDGDLETVLGPR